MKLPDFLEELNQGAEKAFGDHAQKMIDSLLYAKLPPKLKRSVNMARLENGSYDEIVAHLERELELNALEESDDLPMATMTSSSTKPKTPLSTGQMSDITCNYCKEKGHMVKDCEKLKKKKEKDAQQGKSTQKKTYPECGTCGKKNHPEERCWQGAGAHLKPKRTRPEDSTDNKPNSKAQKPQTKPTIRRITLHFLCSSKLSRLSSGILGQALKHTNRKERNSPRGFQGLIPQCIISRDFS